MEIKLKKNECFVVTFACRCSVSTKCCGYLLENLNEL